MSEERKQITQEELNEMIKSHEMWLETSGDEGERLVLKDVSINECIIKDCSLIEAIFDNILMYDCIFLNAYCSGICITNSDIIHCQIIYSHFSDSTFYHNDIKRCLFYGCNSSQSATWSACDFSRTKFIDTFMPKSCISKNIRLFLPQACPSEGEFIGWKKAIVLTKNDELLYEKKEVIVKLLIPAEAARSSATGYKCRCNKALVLDIETLDGQSAMVSTACSWRHIDFIYEIDKWVEVPDFDKDRFVECAPGIHFFVDRDAAVAYEF